MPDIQSPFDVAALVWRKEQFFQALLDGPEAVMRLVDKCHVLIKEFLHEFKRRYQEVNFVHCCADADHQYASFRKIPNLRGLNREQN